MSDEDIGDEDDFSGGDGGARARWAEEVEVAAWNPGGAVEEGESRVASTRLLALQAVAELTASEDVTHSALVRAGFVGLLLALAAADPAAASAEPDREGNAAAGGHGARQRLRGLAPLSARSVGLGGEGGGGLVGSSGGLGGGLSGVASSGVGGVVSSVVGALTSVLPSGWRSSGGGADLGGGGEMAGILLGGAVSLDSENSSGKARTRYDPDSYGAPSAEERMEAIVALANLAENPATHERAFGGLQGSRAFELFVTLIQAPSAAEQREGFRALSCLALARSRAAAASGGGAIDSGLMALLLAKATQALEPQPDGRESDEEVAFHAARALSLLSTSPANRRLIVEHGGLEIMYALARQPDTDIQAEAATVIANVTAASYEAQARVVADGVVQLLLYLCASQHDETRAAASRAVANLTQNVDNEPILREARCQEALFQHVASSSSDVKWQCRRALANLEASRLLVGLRRFGGGSVVVVEPGVIADICKHADAANVGAQREVARALANLAAAEENHELLKAEGGLSLCMDLVVSNSSEVQQQATRCIGNLALASNDALPQHMAEEGVLELLVLLAASWDEGVQEEAAIALASFAERPAHRLAVIRAGAFAPLLEQLKSANPAVAYRGALALMAIQ